MTIADIIFKALEEVPNVYETSYAKDIAETYVAFNETESKPEEYYDDDDYLEILNIIEVDVMAISAEERDSTAKIIRRQLKTAGFSWQGSRKESIREPNLNMFHEALLFHYITED